MHFVICPCCGLLHSQTSLHISPLTAKLSSKCFVLHVVEGFWKIYGRAEAKRPNQK